ncbi:MAG: hypothetical protein PHQ40_17270 [Anaerolineaceae bacterium]|nr:hypothetical protein [Anaerolineaceae bacterium]
MNESISLRDQFAMAAMQGWLAAHNSSSQHPAAQSQKAELIAYLSYVMADAMLAERTRSEKPQ